MGTSSIGKIFTEEQRKELADLNLKPGAILKFDCLIAKKERDLYSQGLNTMAFRSGWYILIQK